MFTAKDTFKPFKHKIWLSSPTMHGSEIEYVKEDMKQTGCLQ